MSREIKFRAFVKKDKAMVSDVRIGSSLNDCFKSDGVIFMQYTGLKDADGAEIYESDIIKMRYAPMATCNGIIEFVDGCFVFTTRQAKPNACSLFACANDYGNSLTVIGNIHQHPELLK